MTQIMFEDLSKDSSYAGVNFCCGQKSCQDSIFVLKDRVGQLTEALQQMDYQIKNLTDTGSKMSKEELLGRIMELPDSNVLLNTSFKNTSPDSNLFSFKDSIGLDSTLSFNSGSRIYEIPVQMDLTPVAPNQEENTFCVEDISEYFKGFEKWADLPNQIEKTLTQLLKTQTEENFVLKKSNQPYFLPFDSSFTKIEKYANQAAMEQSLTLSEIKSLKKNSMGEEIVNKQFSEKEIQTEKLNLSIEECRVTQQNDQQNWLEAQESVNRLKEMFTQIPSQIFPEIEEETENKIKQAEKYNLPLNPNEEAMHNILLQVDEVLGSIQQMLYQLPQQIFEQEQSMEEQSYEEEVIEIEDIYALQDSALKKEKINEQTWNQADLSMSRLSQLILDMPSSKFKAFKPQTILEDDDQSQLDREVFDSDEEQGIKQSYKGDIQAEKKIFNMDINELNTSFTNIDQLRKQLYNIPIEFEMLDNSDLECDLSLDEVQKEEQIIPTKSLYAKMFEINDNMIWRKTEQGKIQRVQKFISQSPVNINHIQISHQANNSQKRQQLPTMENNEERQKFIEECRVENSQLPEWAEIDGTLCKIKKLFYQIPTDCYNFTPEPLLQTKQQEIQTESFDEFSSLEVMAESVDSCDVYLEEQDKDWEEINVRISDIQKRLTESPRFQTKRTSSYQTTKLRIEDLPITHGECTIENYEIPIDLEIQSYISSDTCSEKQEQLIQQEGDDEGEQIQENQLANYLPKKQINLSETLHITNTTQKVTIQKYDIPLEMQLIDEIDEEQTKHISEHPVMKQDRLSLDSNVIVHHFTVCQPKQVFQIPVQMTIYEDFDECEDEDIGNNYPILCKCTTQETQTITEMSVVQQQKQKQVQKQKYNKKLEFSCSVVQLSVKTQGKGQEQNLFMEELSLRQNSVFDRSGMKGNFQESIDVESIRNKVNNFQLQKLDLKYKSPATSRKNYLLMDLEESEGNITDRSFYNRRSVLGFSKFQDTSSLTANMIKEESINAVDFYQILEQRNMLEDQRNKLCDLLEKLNNEIEQLRSKNNNQTNFIQSSKNLYKKQKTQMACQLSNLEIKIFELEKQLRTKLQELQNTQTQKEELSQKIIKLNSQIGQKRSIMNQFDDDVKIMKRLFEDEIKALKEEAQERNNYLAARQRQIYQENEALKLQVIQLQESHLWTRKQNEKLQKSIQEYKVQLNQLTARHNDLIGNLQTLILEKDEKYAEGQSSPAQKIYQGQFKKSMQIIEYEMEQKNKQIACLETEIKILQGKIQAISQQKDKQINNQNEALIMLSEKLQAAETAFKNSYRIPSQLQIQLDYLREQLISATEQLIQKQNNCLELQIELQRIKQKEQQSMLINFDNCSSGVCSPTGKQNNRDDYIRQLQQIIYQHEKIIMENQNEIKELQEKVCEYLGDAIERQEQLQYYDDILQGTEYDAYSTEEAIEKFGTAAKYFMMMNKKNHPTCIEEKEDSASQSMEVSRLSIGGEEQDEDSNSIMMKNLEPDSTANTKLIFTRNQSADDSCLYSKTKLINNNSHKKKGLNQTMNNNNNKRQAPFTRR